MNKYMQDFREFLGEEDVGYPPSGKRCHITIGFPRSGKTTLAKSLLWPVISPDAIRKAMHGQRFIVEAEDYVWATAYTALRSLFMYGFHDVIFDACSVSRRRRRDFLPKLGSISGMYLIGHYIDEPVITCKMRAKDNDGVIAAIERMYDNFEHPGHDEGFSIIYRYSHDRIVEKSVANDDGTYKVTYPRTDGGPETVIERSTDGTS